MNDKLLRHYVLGQSTNCIQVRTYDPATCDSLANAHNSITAKTLRSIIRSGRSNIYHALSEALDAGHQASTFMVYAINVDNVAALVELLNHGEMDSLVAEAAGRATNTNIFELLLSRGWNINKNIGCMPSLLRYVH